MSLVVIHSNLKLIHLLILTIVKKSLNISDSIEFFATLDVQQNFPVFMAVVDDEIDLANLFKEALSQIPNVRVFAFSDPFLALEHFQHNKKN